MKKRYKKEKESNLSPSERCRRRPSWALDPSDVSSKDPAADFDHFNQLASRACRSEIGIWVWEGKYYTQSMFLLHHSGVLGKVSCSRRQSKVTRYKDGITSFPQKDLSCFESLQEPKWNK